jgi:hypothetical protein
MTRAPPPPAPAYGQPQAPSMMATMGSSMAGSMAGSVIGHGIANSMFGGSGHSQPAAVEGQAPPQMAPQPAMCQFETQQFLQCMTQTADNMDYCRQVFDQFKMCNMNAQAQMQQQPRM